MALICIGDGLSNPVTFRPRKTGSDRRRPTNVIFSSICTSSVRGMTFQVWAVRLLEVSISSTAATPLQHTSAHSAAVACRQIFSLKYDRLQKPQHCSNGKNAHCDKQSLVTVDVRCIWHSQPIPVKSAGWMRRYQNGFQLLANVSSKELTLMPAISAYLGGFPPSRKDGWNQNCITIMELFPLTLGV